MPKTCDFESTIKIVESIFTILAIFLGGIWAYWRYRLFRERYAKIEVNVDCRYISQDANGDHIVELIAIVENKGLARQNLVAEKWFFNVRYFTNTDVIDESNEKINHQVNFPVKKFEKSKRWIHNDNRTFIDSGVSQAYTYIAGIPKDIKCITLYTKYIYPFAKEHTAQKTFEIQRLKNLQRQ
jgi:hypothetical protein